MEVLFYPDFRPIANQNSPLFTLVLRLAIG
ncbi:hypothetical protein PM8797T_04890 [Gimesia maris DSM 8797]|nr:hypothetical protein PM8797T_04890 [Gimesia maris DSM 8797]